MTTCPLSAITGDLDWREGELGALKVLLARRDLSEHQRKVLLRVSWALLYAHYEGFVKTALMIFYDTAKIAISNCGALPKATRLFALKSKLKQLKNLPTEQFMDGILSFESTNFPHRPTFPEVNTDSNLWPDVLEGLLKEADLSLSHLSRHRSKLSTLVTRRNKIAHGNREILTEISYYISFEAAVYDIMYELAFAIDERLKQPPYV